MAENKTINIKINSNTKEATKDTKDYNKAVGSTKKQYDAVLKSGDSYEKQLTDINKIVKETPLNVRDMNKQIQAYQSIALSAGRETPVGQEALKKASELRDRYIDIQNETKRLADDQKNLQGAIQLVGTGVAAFGGVQSAMALSGVESEKLRETMVKLQAAQTLMTSINQIATAVEKESSAMLLLKSIRTKALTATQAIYTAVTGKATAASKLFKIALASTGIGLLVVGVGLLIANFDKLLMPMKAAIQALKNFGDAIGLTNFAEKDLNAQRIKQADEERARQEQAIVDLQNYREELKKQATIEKTYSSNRLKRLDTEKKLAMGNAEELAKIDEKVTAEKLAQLDRDKAAFIADQKARLAVRLKNVENNAAAEKRIQNGLSSASKDFYKTKANAIRQYNELEEKLRTNNFLGIQQINDEINSINADATVKNKQELDKRRENYKKYQQDRLNAARKIEDLENSLLEDGIEKDLEINRDKFRRLQEDTKKNTKITAKERKELNDLYTEQEEQSELKIREKYDKIHSDREKKRLAEIEKQNNDFLKTIEDIAEQNYQNTLTDEERELTAVQDKYFALEEAAKGNAEALNEIEIARLNELNDIYNKYQKPIDDKKIADEKAVADAKKSIQDKQIANVEAGISLLKDVAGENNKLQALAIAAENAVGIAKIIISTQAANAAAKLKYAAIPGGLALAATEITANKVSAGIGIAASVAAAAKGIASLKASASLDSGGDLGGGGGGTEAVAPSFNVVGDSGINQIAQLQQQPVQAFVVSGEVTTSQALDRNRVQNATL